MFDVCATKFGSWGTDDTVPHNFCRDHVGCTCADFIWIINEVPPTVFELDFGYFFWGGGWLMTIRAYVIVISFGMHLISVWVR
jgi:hypothetical protein